MVKRYKCVGCRKFQANHPFELCDDCFAEAEREQSAIEKEYCTPREMPY